MQSGFEATTGDITVQVHVTYLDGQSQPEAGQFFWAYHITIINHGVETVQLLKRSWQITDANGRVVNVHGDGVVGKQPVLQPGARFEYSSGTPLSTPTGFMFGTYHMQLLPSGMAFDVAVPAFSLDSPHQDARRH
ncbi:MAG: Co2+/Mg2+ efflux protein ApaG [Rhodospirillales bacterium]|nr:Co2+/Mg2+ efflux protein ApaG [Rhodospirillales bacterium]MDE2319595.1 Co2+/Mg2+ efflux protein ApaG [Rhodospirillales bacterium]